MDQQVGTFFRRFQELRTVLVDRYKFRFVIHTPLGPISIGVVSMDPGSDITLISGWDAQNKPKAYVFTEAQLASYVLELIPEDGAQKTPLGFAKGETVEVESPSSK